MLPSTKQIPISSTINYWILFIKHHANPLDMVDKMGICDLGKDGKVEPIGEEPILQRTLNLSDDLPKVLQFAVVPVSSEDGQILPHTTR